MKREALLYEKLADRHVHCFLCNHHCRIAEHQFGFCGLRQNIGGSLFTYAYGEVISANVDPIEKKPLYHFLPGSTSLSIATIGCNFRCGFCQNWQISQASFKKGKVSRGQELSADEIVASAKKYGCKSISYTYTEPTVFFEYAYETCQRARKNGLYNNFVTNGYMTQEALDKIHPYLSAANVDLKFFRDESYRKICSGRLEPVLHSIRSMHTRGIWVEVTTLIVPGENDSDSELSDIAHFIAGVDKGIPWHVSRFHPDYKFTDHTYTPEAKLDTAFELGKAAGLHYVYLGNVLGKGNDTYCHSCNKLLIRREGFSVIENNLKDKHCPYCHDEIPGVFE